MCGIAGMFGGGDLHVVGSMLDTMRHRGPDDAHAIAGERFAIGARRLSIIDVEGGRQPLTNEDGTIIAAQNGELYNFPILRPQLVASGHRLRTRTDTEVLPHIWEDCGERLPEHIDGMFAVALWDERRQTGFLARDRMGKKPLYYWLDRGTLYFASELKAILAIPGFERRLNVEALHHYLSYKHVPHPLTIFEGVRMLPPAHSLTFTPDEAPVVRRYWSLSFAPDDRAVDEPEATDELLRLMRAAVRRRLMSDVPVGFFLSGGIDSSLTTALAAEQAPERIKTFTLTYASGSGTEGKAQDRRWARWVADKYGTEHVEEEIAFGSFPASIGRILRAFDEPFAGVVSTYFLSERMAQHVKVAVAGDGADELFGSYLSHRVAAGAQQLPEATGLPDSQWRARLLVLTDEEKAALYSPDVREAMASHPTSAHLGERFAQLTACDPLNRMLEAEWGGIFPDQVLTFVDRLSMAHSLEVRSAFLDTEVVEFVARLPGALKIHDGETKYLLKQAARRHFPEEMVARPKEGFLMPVTSWMLGELRPWARDTLSPERLRIHGLFDAGRVASMVDRLSEPGADYTTVNKVLALVIFQEWYELYMNGGRSHQ
jgi:asparagine synthase (glutamine-hydrolysing)